jgi:predicted nucleotidyltransferase
MGEYEPGGDLQDWLKLLREHMAGFRQRYGVTHLWLFGPHARGEAKPGMPLDVLAELSGTLSYADFHALQDELSALAAIPVELVLKGDLDPTILEIIMPEMVAVEMSDFFKKSDI